VSNQIASTQLPQTEKLQEKTSESLQHHNDDELCNYQMSPQHDSEKAIERNLQLVTSMDQSERMSVGVKEECHLGKTDQMNAMG